jgi:hypothetical protein
MREELNGWGGNWTNEIQDIPPDELVIQSPADVMEIAQGNPIVQEWWVAFMQGDCTLEEAMRSAVVELAIENEALKHRLLPKEPILPILPSSPSRN